jgi:putative tryptophan/tyrosine transport system substrate-binding protein
VLLFHAGGVFAGFLSALLSAEAQPVEKEAVPQATRIAVLWNVADPSKVLEWQETQRAVQTLGVTLYTVEVHRPDDVARALAAAAVEHPDALIVFEEKET